MKLSNRTKSTLKYLAVALVSSIITFSITLFNFGGSEFWLRFLIKNYYVEDVPQAVINEGAKAGIVASLGDEHSVYIDSEYGFDSFENSLSGEYSGIGAAISLVDDKAVITEIYSNSPAEKAGLMTGDVITEAAGVRAIGSTISEIAHRLQGENGTSVSVKVRRDGKELEFEITREAISVTSTSWEKLENNIGYIKLSSFDFDTDQELVNALTNLGNSKGIIIDLRDNPGGYMNVAINTIDLFVNEGTIVTAKYKSDETVFSATKENNTSLSDDFLLTTPICVLVNQNSASASEIFSAALKDHQRATIIGQNTYGKGSIQSTFSLKNNSGVKLTVGHFYSPNGDKIDGSGVKPDIEISLAEEYINIPVSTIPRASDLQLKAAINALK